MKTTTVCCAMLIVCLTACTATGATAILIDPAEVHDNSGKVVDNLPLDTEVTTGRVRGQWVEVRYQKPDQDAPRVGWVRGGLLERVPQGFNSRVSGHCIVHSRDPRGLESFDTGVIEELYTGIARSLINAEGEPAFDPNVKLRIYLLNPETFAQQADADDQPADIGSFSPRTGQIYVNFSLDTTTAQMKGLTVHELAVLVILDYANQPRNRQGAGRPVPVWLIEAFATYHEFEAGFNTDDLLYAPDEPRISDLTRKRSVPTDPKDRREYLATAGTLGYLVLNYGTRRRFSELIRRIQASPPGTRSDDILLQLYDMSRGTFQDRWATYVLQLKRKHGIIELEEELEEREEEDEEDDDD
jgi:hypothetical protein